MSEAAIVERARTGDEPARGWLYSANRSKLFTVLLRKTKNHEDAEDLMQVTFMSAFRSLGQFRGDAKFSTWLHRIAINQFLMKIRRAGPPMESLDEISEDGTHFDVPKVDERLESFPRRELIERFSGRLSRAQRAVLDLALMGYSHEEISGALGCAVGSSKANLNRAKRRLRALATGQPTVPRKVSMLSELCGPCKDVGFNILAHYKGIPAGMSHDGKEHPPMCWDHKKGTVPRWIAEKEQGHKLSLPKILKPSNFDSVQEMVESVASPVIIRRGREIAAQEPSTEVQEQTMKSKICICGCGKEFEPTGYAQKYAAGHKPGARAPKEKAATTSPKPAAPTQGRDNTLAALAQVKAKLLADIAAIETVERMLSLSST